VHLGVLWAVAQNFKSLPLQVLGLNQLVQPLSWLKYGGLVVVVAEVVGVAYQAVALVAVVVLITFVFLMHLVLALQKQ